MDQNVTQDPIQHIRDQVRGITEKRTQIVNTALAAKRDLSDEEIAELESLKVQGDKLERSAIVMADALDAQARLEKPAPARISSEVAVARAEASFTGVPVQGATSTSGIRAPITGRDLAATSPTHGFEHALAWLRAIQGAQSNPSMTDRRLTNAKAAAMTYANEGAGPDGGWGMPTEFSANIVQAVAGQASLLGRMQPMQSTSNVYQIPIDETTDWGTTGPQAAKTAEGSASTVSSLVLQNRTVSLFKATAMLNVSEELASDNPAVVQHISRAMAGRLQAQVERWILRGSGAGEPLGILNAPALISVAADGSQTAATITKTNLSKCIGRLIPGSESNSFFVVSPSAKIGIMDLLLAASGNRADNLQQNFGLPSVLGTYPVITSMEAQPIGTAGDCTLVAPQGFLTLVKGGVQSQATIYFYFDQGLQTLRSYIRVGQTPLLSGAITPKLDTATTLSHCVTIAVRS